MLKLVSKKYRERTVVKVGDVKIECGRPIVIAGPCSVESRDQIAETALAVKEAGADMLRGAGHCNYASGHGPGGS